MFIKAQFIREREGSDEWEADMQMFDVCMCKMKEVVWEG